MKSHSPYRCSHHGRPIVRPFRSASKVRLQSIILDASTLSCKGRPSKSFKAHQPFRSHRPSVASSASGSEGSSVSGSSSSNNFLLQRGAQQPSCGPPSQSRAHRASPAPFRGSSAPLSASSDSAGIREALRVPLHHKDEAKGWSRGTVTVTKDDGTQLVYYTSRRDALHQMLLGVGALSTDSLRWMWAAQPAGAALLQFPATSLHNKYFLVRAGEGESEADNYVLTNPVAKTSMSSGLSQRGKMQVVRETAPALKALGACANECWLWPSITQRSYQTAEILAALFGVGRSRIVPEYSFLDPRGLGALEGLSWESARLQVNAGDRLTPEWRPPRGTDGTPNESITDVLVRVRQVMSVMETQYRGADVIVVSPDSDNLSVLQAALLGIDLRRHAELGLRPGEVRAVELAAEEPKYYSGKVACERPPACA